MTNQPTTKLVRVPEDELAALKAENKRLRSVAEAAAAHRDNQAGSYESTRDTWADLEAALAKLENRHEPT